MVMSYIKLCAIAMLPACPRSRSNYLEVCVNVYVLKIHLQLHLHIYGRQYMHWPPFQHGVTSIPRSMLGGARHAVRWHSTYSNRVIHDFDKILFWNTMITFWLTVKVVWYGGVATATMYMFVYRPRPYDDMQKSYKCTMLQTNYIALLRCICHYHCNPTKNTKIEKKCYLPSLQLCAAQGQMRSVHL